MSIEFDFAKDAKNQEKHGISLKLADQFDFTTAIVRVDDRMDYGECRYIAYGHIGNRLHVLIFTIRNGIRRAISLRKANPKERQYHDEAKKII